MNQADIANGEAGSSARSKLNIMKDNIISSAHVGKVRAVYLVEDAADVTHLTGAGNNVYNTAQAAYNAANAIQVALGGTNRVIVYVGNTNSANVGDITLTANWNFYVEFVGISPLVSQIGNIIATNAGGNGYRVGFSTVFNQYAKFSNLKIGNITTSATGASGSSATVGLNLNNCEVGNIDTSITDVSNTTGTGGNVGIGSNTLAQFFSISSITTTAKGTTAAAGSVTSSTAGSFRIGAITTANDCGGGAITLTPYGSGFVSSITSRNSVSAAGNLNLSNISVSGTITLINDTLAIIQKSTITGAFTYTSLNPGDAELRAYLSKFTTITGSSDYSVKILANQCAFESITYLGYDSHIADSVFDNLNGAAANNINEFGVGCFIRNTSFRSIAPNYCIYSSVSNGINIDNVTLKGGTAGAFVRKESGVPLITDVGGGTFNVDGSVYDAGKIVLTGGTAGANSLNMSNAIINNHYRFMVVNTTGSDTLAIYGLNNTYTEGGVPFAPTASVGAVDFIDIFVDENLDLWVTPQYNFA